MTRSFDAMWMAIARDAAAMSTCRVNVGCVLVQHRKLIGLGYVGSIKGEKHCNDVGCLTAFSPATGRESCIRTVHAEMNAIVNATKLTPLDPVTAYSTHEPCLVCTKLLLQFGVVKICYAIEYKDQWRTTLLGDLQSSVIFELYQEG